jgi:predicted MFS family arabinose efflux permease
LLEHVLGDEVDPRVKPIVAVTFVYAVFSTFWVYVGVFAVKGLGAAPRDVGFLFLASAPAAAVANYVSGAVSDRLGRRSLIIASFAASAANMVALYFVRGHLLAASALIVLQGVLGAPAYSLDRVLVADYVVEPETREQGYAVVRVANNLGILVGPPIAALLIHLQGWSAFLLGLAAVGVVGTAVSASVLPRGRPLRDEQQSVNRLMVVLRDGTFGLLLLSTLLGFTIYVGYETVLPVIAVSSYGLAPSTWGLLLVIAPLLVVVAQLRLTHATARVNPAGRLVAAMLLMGLPFLALIADNEVAVIAGVIVLFVIGEMVWIPTSQALAAALAPAPARGTYFGALAAMTGPAWTLVPFVSLELRAGLGVPAVWLFFAVAAVAGAAVGAAAARAAAVRPATYSPSGRGAAPDTP